VVVKIQDEELFKRAKQGNTQAIMALLNRHLLSKGAHVKIKQKADCLQLLLQTSHMAEKKALLQVLREQLLTLCPPAFKQVKIYSPRPGSETASLIYEFDLVREPSTPAIPSQSSRYSIADFLSDATSIDDLLAVRQHPFFSGRCPQCGQTFNQLNPPPVHWDCGHCGWIDNLDHIAAKMGNPSPQKTLGAIKRLGNYLIEAGLLTPDQLEVALADQKITGMRLGEVLAHRGWVKEETIEYLMKKVVLPERSPSKNQSAVLLELSRKLVKALSHQPASEAFSEPLSQPKIMPPTHAEPPAVVEASAVSSNKGRINDRATLVLPDVDLSDL
jgi:hypothetical protein